MKNKDVVISIVAPALLLLVPLFAKWPWTISDFIIMGALLVGAGLLISLARRKVRNTNYRLVIMVGILIAFFLVWAELAVGIFGTPFAGS